MKKIYEAPFVEIKEFASEDTMATTFVSSINVVGDLSAATHEIDSF